MQNGVSQFEKAIKMCEETYSSTAEYYTSKRKDSMDMKAVAAAVPAV